MRRKNIVKRAKKAYNSMPKPDTDAMIDADFVVNAFGLPKDEIRRLCKLRDELADAGIVAPITRFHFPNLTDVAANILSSPTSSLGTTSVSTLLSPGELMPTKTLSMS